MDEKDEIILNLSRAIAAQRPIHTLSLGWEDERRSVLKMCATANLRIATELKSFLSDTQHSHISSIFNDLAVDISALK